MESTSNTNYAKTLKNKNNVRKIITHKTQTAFYFFKEDGERLKAELKKYKRTRSFKFVWDVNRFVVKTNISKEFKLKLIKLFEPKKPIKIESKNIIRGYYGCPITGYNFGWK